MGAPDRWSVGPVWVGCCATSSTINWVRSKTRTRGHKRSIIESSDCEINALWHIVAAAHQKLVALNRDTQPTPLHVRGHVYTRG